MKIKQNKDSLFILLTSLIITILLINNKFFIQVYINKGLNDVLLPIFGVFLGGLITAYTLTIAFHNQIPRKIKETKAYQRVNTHFLITLYSLILLIISSISLYFIDGNVNLFINLLLSTYSTIMVCYLILIIYKLVYIINKSY